MVQKDSVETDGVTQDELAYGLSHKHSRKIIESIECGDRDAVRNLLKPMHVADIADFINVISHEHRKIFIGYIKDEFDPEILVKLEHGLKEGILDLLGTKESANAIKNLDTDDAVDVIEDLDEYDQRELLGAIPKKKRKELEEGLAYPADSAGRLLDKKVVSVPEFWTVGQTIDFLRAEKDIPDEFYQIFILDPKMKPVGGVMLSRVMRSKRSVLLKDIMRPDLKLIEAEMDQEEVAFIFRQYGLVSAPVVNKEGRMMGIITVDDVVDVMEEEAQEDILHLGGITETDFHANFLQTIQQRFPWLMVNLVTAIMASVVIGFFEGTIEKLASLAVLMPIVASMGGNAGTQTVTVMVRAIATKELTATNAMRVVSKEILVGSLNGVVFAVIMGVVVYLWYDNFYMSVTFAAATIVTLLFAGMSGALIPIGLVRFGVDPAIASSVVLTTITDIIAFGVFLGLAAMLFV